MAKKTTKKTDVVETTQELNVEQVAQNITEEIEKTAEIKIDEVINDYVSTYEDAMNDIDDTVKSFTEEMEKETSKKNEFLTNMETELAVKTEEELKDALQKEIARVDEVIAKVSQNKIPMTTRYWNGMNYDF